MTREEAHNLTERLADAVARFAKSQHGQSQTDYQAQADAYNAQNEIIAALAPAPHADDVALVDAFAQSIYFDNEHDGSARTALLALLSQRRADRDAVIEECENLLDAFCEHHRADRSDEWHSGVEAAAREIRALKGA